MAGLRLPSVSLPTSRGVVVLNPSDARFRRSVKKAILGSAHEVDSQADVNALRGAAQPWQLEALAYRHTLGEIRYASDFYARPLRRLDWFVGEIQDDGKIQPTEDPTVQAILARVRDPGGGTQGLLTNYGRLMFCTGEALLLYTPEHEDADMRPQAEAWEMLSTAELRPQADGSMLRFPRGGTGSGGEPLVEGSTIYRLWQNDPMYSQLADAPMRAVLPLCEELAILTLVVRARAVSRLAGNGILFIPNEITLAPRAGVQPQENMEEDPFFEELIKVLLASLEDQGNASAVVPLLVRGPAEAGKEIRHISVRDTQEIFPENELRNQTIRRLGLGLDMPPEALEGVGDVNHWGGWQVERDAWRHAEPFARSFADDMTAAYLRPALIDAGYDPARYVVAYDASEILTNPDRGADAKDALSLGAIGWEAYRDAMGWPDDAAPPDDEVPLILQYLGKAPVEQPAPAGTETGPPPGDSPTDPDAPDAGDSADEATVASLLGAAEVAVLRHREVAGAKIRTKANGCEPCKEDIDGVANSLVAATLGYDAIRDLALPGATRLVEGREAVMAAACNRFGLSEAQARAVAALVEHHAARTLFDMNPAPFPPSAFRAVLGRNGSG